MEICFSYSRGGYFPLSCFNSAMSASTILHNHPADLVIASATSLRRILWRSPSLAGRPGYPDKDSSAGLPWCGPRREQSCGWRRSLRGGAIHGWTVCHWTRIFVTFSVIDCRPVGIKPSQRRRGCGDDRVEIAVDLGFLHSENRAV